VSADAGTLRSVTRRAQGLLGRGLDTLARWCDRPLLVVGVAAGARVALTGILLGTHLAGHNGWYFRNEDQGFYFTAADSFVRGELAPYYQTIGYPLMLAPAAAAVDWVFQAIPPVAIVQFVLGLGVAFLLFLAGSRLLDRRSAALGTALWLAAPLLLGPLFGSVGPLYIPTYDFWSIHAPLWLGLTISPDYASALLAIVVLAVASGAYDDGSVRRGLVLGAVCGAAALTKPPNAVLLFGALAALVAWRRWRTTVTTVVTALVVFTPQLVFNDRLFGSPTSFGYSPGVAARELPFGFGSLTHGTFSLSFLPRSYGKLAISNYLGPLLLVAVALALVVTWRRFPAGRWLVVAPAVAFGILVGAYYYAIDSTYLRLILPALPLLGLAVGGALVGGRGPSALPRRARRPGIVATALAAAVACASVGLAVWIHGARPAGPDTAIYALGLTTVTHSMHPVATVDDGAVHLRWTEPSAPADLSYIVLRTSAPQPTEPLRRGFQWNGPPGDALTYVPRHLHSVDDRPPVGTWWYRIAIAPGHLPGGWPSEAVAAVSPPVRVVVP
jgi:hypothetical protein